MMLHWKGKKVVYYSYTPRIRVYLNNGGVFSQTVQTFDDTNTIAVADMDGDGDVDLQLTGDSYLNDGFGSFSLSSSSIVAFITSKIYFEDIDSDGDEDALVYTGSSGQVVAYLNDGSGGYSSGGILLQGIRQFIPDDIDMDGRVDFIANSVWVNQNNLILSDSNQTISSGSALDGDEYNSVLIEDLDGDGDGDNDFARIDFGRDVIEFYFNSQTRPVVDEVDRF